MAVTVELELLLMVPVVAVNVAVVAVAATIVEAGTVRVALLLASVIVAPPVGAGCDSVTVQMLDEFCPKLAGLHDREETDTVGARVTVDVAEVPL